MFAIETKNACTHTGTWHSSIVKGTVRNLMVNNALCCSARCTGQLSHTDFRFIITQPSSKPTPTNLTSAPVLTGPTNSTRFSRWHLSQIQGQVGESQAVSASKVFPVTDTSYAVTHPFSPVARMTTFL